MTSTTRRKGAYAHEVPNLTTISILTASILLFTLTIAPVSALNCRPDMLGDDSASWNTKRGPYTYIETSKSSALTKMGDNTVTNFAVEFAVKGSIHLQIWTQVQGNQYVLKYDQKFSAADPGMHELQVEWDIDENDHWGFSYDENDDIPVMYKSDSMVQAIGEAKFLGASAMIGQQVTVSQDAPMMFNIKVCTDRMDSSSAQRTRSSSGVSYTCERKASWDSASEVYDGSVTYINGKKINTPTAMLKDLEVQMAQASFITVQVWRKDPANFEFLLVKEKTFYAKQGYNSIPVNMDMQFGDQWGFSLDDQMQGELGNPIKYQNVTSDNSYFFPEFVSGVGSKRSYASLTPTPMEFQISACLEVNPQQNSFFANGQQGQQYQQGGFYGNGAQMNGQFSGQMNSNGQYGFNAPNNPSWQNTPTFPASYGPYGGAQNIFFPQQSATSCYCADNTFWYSAQEQQTGPYTYIDPDAFTEQNGNIEAFELEAFKDGRITLQIWRPAGPGMNAMSLIWEKDVSVRAGYQRINLAYTLMAGDRWGFVTSDSTVPIQYYNDESSYGHEFSYQVSASTGQQIFLSSAIVTPKKFKIRPCICSFMNGAVQMGAGMPYMTAPYTTMDGISSGLNVMYGNSVQNTGSQQQQQFGNSQWNNNGQMQSNFGMSINSNSNGYASQNCMGSNIQSSGQCSDCGNLEVVGPYTYINFMKLPRGRLESVDILARNAGSIMVQIWRYDSSSRTFKIFYEEPASLRNFPPVNTIRINKEVQENDMIGFSYLGNGVVPVQFANAQGTQAYEENTGYSNVIGRGEIQAPTSFISKKFNMKVCMVSSSFQAQSSMWMNNPQSMPQYNQNMQFANSVMPLMSNAYMQATQRLSQGFQTMIGNLLLVMNQGVNAQEVNDMQSSSSTSSGTPANMGSCQRITDGESEGPYENEIRGPYTYIGDFEGVSGQCVKYVKFMANAFEEVTIFRARPSFGNFEIMDDKITVMPESITEPTVVETNWCLASNEKIGFYYEGSNQVPIKFTYSWGSSQELPMGLPEGSSIAQLFDTSKSFQMCVHIGVEDAQGNIQCPASQSNQQSQSSYNSGYNSGYQQQTNFNSGYGSSYGINQNMNGYSANFNTYGSPNGYNPNNYNNWQYQSSNSFGANGYAGYQQNNGGQYQRLYISPGSPFSPLLDQNPSVIGNPSCIGNPIDTQVSLAGFTYDAPGGSYLIPEGFQRPGRLAHIELEASKVSRIALVHFGKDQQGQFGLKNVIEYNLFPGINKISQQYVDWMVEPEDVIGMITDDQVSPITYTVDVNGAAKFNFNACLEDRQYNSPTTYQYPGQNSGLVGAGGLSNGFGAGSMDTCSCYDNAHWPFGFEEVYGPYSYINGEDFRQVSGFVQAFEIDAAISGPVTLHIWRKSSPFSDRLTKIWSKDVVLQAGYQRIEGINTNIQDGDLWGFTFRSQGMVPINFLTDTNYFGYEVKDATSVGMTQDNVMYLSSANIGFKRFKIRPCICTYQTQSNVNQIGMGFQNSMGTLGGSGQMGFGYSQQMQGSQQPQQNGYQLQNFGFNGNAQFSGSQSNGYAQQSSMAPQYPTNSYQYCYGALNSQGSMVKFGPYNHINFEPLPKGTIQNIEFEASRPGTMKWLLWRNVGPLFTVVFEKEVSFQSGKQSIELMVDTEDRDLIGFYYGESNEIPIKFAENVGAQSYEDVSPAPPTMGSEIDPPNDLEDKLFNYKVCMYSITNDAPIQTTSNIGGYGFTYSQPTAPYYASGPAFGPQPGFGPSPSPLPGYDYTNNYYPNPTYGISQYDPVQAYNYDYYGTQPATPSYGNSMSYNSQQQGQAQMQTGTPYGYNQQPWQNQYQSNQQQTQGYNSAYGNGNYNQQYSGSMNTGGYYY